MNSQKRKKKKDKEKGSPGADFEGHRVGVKASFMKAN